MISECAAARQAGCQAQQGPALGHGCDHLHQGEVLVGLLPCGQVQHGGSKPLDVSVRPSHTKFGICLLWCPVCLHTHIRPANTL